MFEKIEKFVSCACVSIMAVLVFSNVIARFLFKHSLAVSDEMSTYLFVLMSFMGTAIAARRISVLFCLLIVFFGVQMVISQYRLGQETANMQWPEWIYGAFVPIGAAFAAIAFFQTMLVMCKEYKEQEGEK